MQGLLDAGAVVFAEFTDLGVDCGDVVGRYRRLREVAIIVGKAGFGQATEVEDDFDEFVEVREADESLTDGRGEDVEERFEFPFARRDLGQVLFQIVVTSCDVRHQGSTRMVPSFLSTGPWMWTPALSSNRRYSIVSCVMRSPGHNIGIDRKS